MQILGPVIGNEIQLNGTTFLRVRNGELWIELDFDGEFTYVYEVLDTVMLEAQYREVLAKQAK